MIVQVLLLVFGLALIVFGADWLVDGASSIARKVGISEFVIGLTIVGFGTSMPELVVSLNGAFLGNADISIGNVIGSNIFNTLLILGVTALLMPIPVTKQNVRRDIPVTMLVTCLFCAIGMRKAIFGFGSDTIDRWCALVFLALFALYIFLCFKTDSVPGSSEQEADRHDSVPLWKAILLVVLGLCGLIFGGRFFVDSATSIARMIGVSDKFIAITVLAGGTSLPELATCIVAAAKKKGQLALGNILGSNVFNILLIIGGSALVSPLSLGDIDVVDVCTFIGAVVIVAVSPFTFRKNMIDRVEGVVMIMAFAAYYVYLFSRI